MPNTYRRRRRDSTVELSRVGVASASAVCIEFAISSRRLPTTADENLETEHIENLSCQVELCRRCVRARRLYCWVTTGDGCFHTADTTQLDFVVGKLFRLVETRRDCRQLVANSVHAAVQLSCVGGVYWALSIFRKQQWSHQTVNKVGRYVW